MVLYRAWEFVKRHKRKFIFTGVLVGGVYWGLRYAQRKLQEFQEIEAAECLEHAKRQHHFDSNQRTCNMTVTAMLPSLKEALMRELDSEALTEQLKHKPANKVEIWEELKIISLTRTLSAVYSVSIVIVFLRIQLNVIGGYMYMDSVHNKDGLGNNRPKASHDVQKSYLELVQYACEDGLLSLISTVRTHVQHEMQNVSLKEPMSLIGVQALINKVRQHIETSSHDSHECPLTPFVMPAQQPTTHFTQEDDDVTMQKLWKETHDLVKSEDFHTVLTACLDTAFSRLIDKLAEFYKPQVHQENNTVTGHHIPMTMPLAKLIPVINGLIHTVLGDPQNPYVQELLLKEQVKDFAANIYEAFSSPDQPALGPL